MIGYNADEGNGYYILYVAPRLSVDVDKGISYDLVKKGLKTTCQRLTKMSVELCVEYVTYLYELDTIADDQHRAISFIQFYSKFSLRVKMPRDCIFNKKESLALR